MKIMRTLLTSTAPLLFGGAVFAQVDFISVEKIADYQQSDAGTVAPRLFVMNPTPMMPPLSAPYQFRIDVQGVGINPPGFSTPTFGVPVGSSYPIGNMGANTLGYNPSESEWTRAQLFGQKLTANTGPGGTPGGLDGIFNNGDYVVTVGGVPVHLTLGGLANADVYPSGPMAIVTGGLWSGGVLKVNPGEAITIDSGVFSGFLSNGYVNHIGISVFGNSSEVGSGAQTFSDDIIFGDQDNGDHATYEIDPNSSLNPLSLVAGQTYTAEIEFNTIVDQSSEYGGALAVALFTSRTSFQIQVIPEASTFAAIAGALALVGAMYARRRNLG